MKYFGLLFRSIAVNITAKNQVKAFNQTRIMSKRSLEKVSINKTKFENCEKSSASNFANSVSQKHLTEEPIKKKTKSMGKAASERLSHENNVQVERLEDPIKSESDKKEYRTIKLPNGLTALLISDLVSGNLDDEVYKNENDETESKHSQSEDEDESGEESEDEMECENDEVEESEGNKKDANNEKLAACSLTIKVGSFSGPPEIPGLAHFLEHMVFMGSKKYPEENELESYLNKKGGHVNAWTECEDTTFYFEVHEKYLQGGLDRFSQFFISPLMKRDAITREREAVDSEFQISKPSDNARREEIMSNLALENHPVRIFRWGNLVSLKDNVCEDKLYEELHKFRERHYSAHRMTLAIQARLSLDVLEDLVVKYFSGIPSNNLPPTDFSDFKGPDKFYSPNFHKIIKIRPIKDIRKVEFTWVLPSLLHQYKSKPLNYLSSIIGHEGKGSLVSYLRKKRWCLDLISGNDESGFQYNTMYSTYSLYMYLTGEGCENLQEICNEVFSYINMLKKAGPQERIYKELEKIEEISFRFEKEQSPLEYAENLSDSMHYYEPKDYLRGGSLFFEYNPEEICRCLDAIDPAKVNIIIEKKKFNNEVFDKVEPWFGTEYKQEDIPEESVERWQKIEPRSEFHLPEPNIFITEDFSMVPLPENVPKYPVKVYKDDKLEVWFRMDPKFRLPDVCMKIKLVTNLFQESCENSAMSDIYVKYLALLLVEEMYPANIAKLEYKLISTRKGLRFDFYGFNEKIPLLVKTVMKYVAEFPTMLQEDLFDVIKEREVRGCYNRFLKPKNLTKDARFKIMLEPAWTSVEKHETLQKVTFEQFVQFSKQLSEKLYIKFHAQGNMTEESVIQLAKNCVDWLNFKPLEAEKRPKIIVKKLPLGETYCKLKNMDKNDANSIVTSYYQSEQTDLKGLAIIDLLTLIMEEPLFNQLRTQEQLGYIVGCYNMDTFGVQGIMVIVNTQANKFTTETVDEKIESFLQSFTQELSKMSEKEFVNVKDSLIKLKRTADNELQEECKRNWEEIESEKYVFDRREQDVKMIEKISLQELRDWFEVHTKGGKDFRKLSVHVIGINNEKNAEKEQSTAEDDISYKSSYKLEYITPEEEQQKIQPKVNYISDIITFKKTLETFPEDINPYESCSTK